MLFVVLIALGGFVYWQFGGKLSGLSGLFSIFSSSTSGTGTGAKDTTAPVISNIKVTPGVVSATISWKTDELSSTQVDYWTGTETPTSEPLQPDKDPTSGKSAGVIDHAAVLKNLKAATTYNYKVKSKDKAGNLAVSQVATFKTQEMPAESPPST